MPILPILLSEGYIPLVKESQKVTIGHVLAKRPQVSEMGIDLAKELGVPIRKIPSLLLKNPGDAVAAGEAMVGKKNFFGKVSPSIISTVDGVITKYERDTGFLYVRESGEPENAEDEELVCPIEGIIAMCNNEKILIDTDKNVILGKQGIGKQITEEIVQLPHAEVVAPYHLDADTIGKIVIGTFFPKEVLSKGLSMGVAGIIATRLSDTDVLYLKERDSDIPIIEVSEEDNKKLRSWHGKKAYLHGEGKTIILLHG